MGLLKSETSHSGDFETRATRFPVRRFRKFPVAGVPYIVFARNAGGGTFATPTMTQPQGAQGIVATGDFNGDGNLDLLLPE